MDRDLSSSHRWDQNSGMPYPSLDGYRFEGINKRTCWMPKDSVGNLEASTQTLTFSTQILQGHERTGDWTGFTHR